MNLEIIILQRNFRLRLPEIVADDAAPKEMLIGLAGEGRANAPPVPPPDSARIVRGFPVRVAWSCSAAVTEDNSENC